MIVGGSSAGRETGTEVPEAPGPRSRIDSWRLLRGELDLSGPVVMGILNLTPDSFSDGGVIASVEAALDRAWAMVEEGAGILDIGGESTRPGARPVPQGEEMERILPFFQAAAGTLPVPLSVDTRTASVAREALRCGAEIVNDVSGLKHDPRMAEVVAEGEGGLVLSHMRGTPATMRGMAVYDDVVAEVGNELRQSIALAHEAGIALDRIVVDPGIGFAKTGAQSLSLVRELRSILTLGRPVLIGPSRKSFIGDVTGVPTDDRLPGTIAACVFAYLRGARIFRVHEVGPVVQALQVARALENGTERPRNEGE
jgi:dihydropteroate synthase